MALTAKQKTHKTLSINGLIINFDHDKYKKGNNFSSFFCWFLFFFKLAPNLDNSITEMEQMLEYKQC